MKTTPIEVHFKDCMGSDLDVVNAARVSFNKEHEEFEPNDEKLIKYLAEHNHWSPFSHCFIKFHIKAPIFIARQLQKHTVGLAWNEVSRRYVSDEPEFYIPDVWRGKPENAKQGSSGEVSHQKEWTELVKVKTNQNLQDYLEAISHGIAPEQARMLLPQNTMTEWIWSGSLYAFARVCNLRLGHGAQEEAGDVAQGIKSVLELLFPISYKYLLKE